MATKHNVDLNINSKLNNQGFADVNKETKNLTNNTKDVNKETQNLANQSKKSLGVMKAGFLVAAAAAAAFTKTIVDGIKGFVETKRSAIVLRTAVVNNMNLSAKAARDFTAEINTMANNMEKKLGIADTSVRKLASGMAVAGLSTDQIKKSLSVAADVAAGTGDSFETVGDLITQSLIEPEKAYTKLKKAGIVLNEEMLKTLPIAEAQKYILDEMSTKYSGLAEESFNADGGISAMSIAWENFTKVIGERVLPVLTPLFNTITDIIGTVGDFVGGFLSIFSSANDASDAMAALTESTDIMSDARKRQSELQGDVDKLKGLKVGTTEYTKSIAKLLEKYPELITQGVTVGDTFGDVSSKVGETSKEILRLAKIKAFESFDEAGNKMAKLVANYAEAANEADNYAKQLSTMKKGSVEYLVTQRELENARIKETNALLKYQVAQDQYIETSKELGVSDGATLGNIKEIIQEGEVLAGIFGEIITDKTLNNLNTFNSRMINITGTLENLEKQGWITADSMNSLFKSMGFNKKPTNNDNDDDDDDDDEEKGIISYLNTEQAILDARLLLVNEYEAERQRIEAEYATKRAEAEKARYKGGAAEKAEYLAALDALEMDAVDDLNERKLAAERALNKAKLDEATKTVSEVTDITVDMLNGNWTSAVDGILSAIPGIGGALSTVFTSAVSIFEALSSMSIRRLRSQLEEINSDLILIGKQQGLYEGVNDESSPELVQRTIDTSASALQAFAPDIDLSEESMKIISSADLDSFYKDLEQYLQVDWVMGAEASNVELAKLKKKYPELLKALGLNSRKQVLAFAGKVRSNEAKELFLDSATDFVNATNALPEAISSGYQSDLDELDVAFGLGEISQEEYDRKQLEIYDDWIEALREAGVSEDYIRKIMVDRLDLEREITGEKDKQNEADNEQAKAARNKLDKIKSEIAQGIRLEGSYDTLMAQQSAYEELIAALEADGNYTAANAARDELGRLLQSAYGNSWEAFAGNGTAVRMPSMPNLYPGGSSANGNMVTNNTNSTNNNMNFGGYTLQGGEEMFNMIRDQMYRQYGIDILQLR